MQACHLRLDVRLVRLIAMHIVRIFGLEAIVHGHRQPEAKLPGIMVAAGLLKPAEYWPLSLNDIVHFEDQRKQSGTADANVFRAAHGCRKCEFNAEDRILRTEREAVLSEDTAVGRSQMVVESANG